MLFHNDINLYNTCSMSGREFKLVLSDDQKPLGQTQLTSNILSDKVIFMSIFFQYTFVLIILPIVVTIIHH